MGRGLSVPAVARYFARGMVRPAMLAAIALLIVPIAVLTLRHSLYAGGGNTITVNSLLDPGTVGDHLCQLREAIANANAKADTSSGDCAAGTGNDTIVFSLSGTIALASGLPSILHTVEIDGTGQTIAIDGGGANRIMLNFSGSLTLNNLTISNGDTTGGGGAIFNSGTLAATNSTFLGNKAALGGAIFNSSGTLTVSNCTFSGNVSPGGGAIQTEHSATVTSSTFSNNSAGGVAGAGAAILANNATLTVTNSIMANSTGLNCGVSNGGVIANGGDDISDDSSCGLGSSTAANGDTIGDNVNPLLDTSGLQNNGGPTDTIALQATSPAVNAVPIANCLPTDQRGDPRPDPSDSSGACDIGAFESIDALGSPTATATATATDTSGATPTATSTPTNTATATDTATATATATATDTATATQTSTATPTATATSTATATATDTATATPTSTATATDTATATATITATPTITATATATSTATPTATATPKPPPIKLTISPKSLNFGSVGTGNAPTRPVTLHNKSKTNDLVSIPQVSGRYFSLARNDCAAGVAPGGTCQIFVSFAPQTKGKKFTGSLTFKDQSKPASHKIKLDGKSFLSVTPTPTATPSITATATLTATATPTASSTGATGTPTATATATASPTSTSTATYTLTSISESVSGTVFLTNPNATPNSVETTQAVAVSTPSFTDSISVSDTNVDISGSASASQTSAANGVTISANESAAANADLSLCGPSPLCIADNQGITNFDAQFCITSNTNYSLTGTVQASANQDLGNIHATGVVSIETIAPMPVLIVNEQASNGQDVPISMSVPLPAGCYDMNVEVFSDALPSGTGGGSASASCNVLLSPE